MRTVGLYLSGRPDNGGSYQYWLAMLKSVAELDKQKYEVKLFYKNIQWRKLAEKYGLTMIELKEKRGVLYSLAERMLWRFPDSLWGDIISWLSMDLKKIKKENLDIFVSNSVNGIGDILGIPTIVPIFDLMHRYEEAIEVKQEYLGRDKFYLHQCQYAELILVDSNVGKEQVLECYGESKNDLADRIEVLPFIPPDYIYNVSSTNKIKYELFDKYLFYPAQFWTHKNHIRLLEVIDNLNKENLDINLVLVGSEQNNKNNVEYEINKRHLEKNVKILGYVSNEEMVYLYKHARALIMPTLFGPTNIPQLEAFELGCPVATSRIYGIPEQVGDAALLFNPRSVEEMQQAVRRIWTDDELCKTLIKRGRQKAESWNQKQFGIRVGEILERYFDNNNY